MEERHRLVQTLIINDLDEILLCKWHDGPCAGKYTACLGDAIEGESDEASAAAVVRARRSLSASRQPSFLPGPSFSKTTPRTLP